MINVPAAQYLRVSTERQEYSLDFQSARIANYATENGFDVCQTYCDEARSGLEIGRRRGLSQLLQDVVGTNQFYKAVRILQFAQARSQHRTNPLIYLASAPKTTTVDPHEAFSRASTFRAAERHKNLVIEVTYFGQANVVYYWNTKHKKIEAVQTED